MIRQEELVPEALGRKIAAALEGKAPRTRAALDTRGVENTARILMEIARSEGRAEVEGPVSSASRAGMKGVRKERENAQL